MKTYIKPAISEVELFTQDAISLSIPKTTYKRQSGATKFSKDQLIAMVMATESVVGLQ
ncbi:MAG: hypothetical protein IKJ06_04725 [Clostridia bacterium]|nr:hypothetical protein [Clostridia bacterium]